MRRPRLKAPPTNAPAYYHCISRVVGRAFLLGDREKEVFVGWMRAYAEFCGVRIVTYCLMSNHFHILVEVPSPPQEPLTDQLLIARLRALGGATGVGTLEQRLVAFRKDGDDRAAEALRATLLGRMWDVSWFMKLLKQRFSAWYNRRHGRKGTLWEERFRSVLVESAGPALATMAAYIDLNPVRAGLVKDPATYRWCGFADAVAGNAAAQAAYGLIFPDVSHGQRLAEYRVWLYGQGAVKELPVPGEEPRRLGFDPAEVQRVLATGGRLELPEYLRCKVRYFSDGLVFGSRGYVDSIFQTFRGRFGRKRTSGARRFRGVEKPLYSMRNLRLSPVTVTPSST